MSPCVRVCQKTGDEEVTTVMSEDDDDELSWPPPQPRPVDVHLSESNGRVYIDCQPNTRHFSDIVIDDGDTTNINETVPLTALQLDALHARSSPDVFKRAVFYVESSRSIYARPLDHSFPRIMINARILCGRAFHGDEVLVEIVDFGRKLDLPRSVVRCMIDGADREKPAAQLQQIWAKVVGVFKRAVDPKYRMFVCQVEDGNPGVMVPLNRGISKIFNVERQEASSSPEDKVAVYAFTKSKQIIFDHYQTVHDVNSLLFVVRYLKWEDHCKLPVGVVVSVLPPGVTLENTMAILDVEYAVPQRFRESTLAEVKLYHSSSLSEFPASVLRERTDYRNKLVFTIDPPNSQQLDNALSFEELPGETSFMIGVHVADVTHFVAKSSSVDSEARQRGSSFHTALGQCTSMLPPELSENLCSLLPNTDRLTLSVYIKVNASADILSVEIKRSIVRSHYRLCYSETEAIINGMTVDDGKYSEELKFAIMLLNRVAQLWRTKRLGRDALYTAVTYSTLDGQKAHKLVEEMTLAANHQVALYLLSKFPLCTALRCQSPPDARELGEWKRRYLTAVEHSVVLSRGFCAVGEVCHCTQLCDCLSQSRLAADAAGHCRSNSFEMMLSLWPHIWQALDDFDSDRLQSLVMSPEFHPHQAVALSNYELIQNESVYRCCGELETDMERRHHSLNLSACVHFTSPVHRYIDMVNHRLVVNALDGDGPCYSHSDIMQLCRDCTDVARRTELYDRANCVAHLCDLLMRRPVVLQAVVDQLTDTEFQLLFPTIQSFFPSRLKVKLSSLNTSSSCPLIGADSESLQVMWSQRVYNSRDVDVVKLQHAVMEVSAHQYTVHVPADAWTELLVAAADDDMPRAYDAVHQIDPYVVMPTVDSEGFEMVSGQDFVKYSLRLHVGGVVMVQLTTELHRGLLRPSIQLFYVTRSTCVCVEHVTAAVKCFCKVATKSAARSTYSSVSEYKRLWAPVLAMEAVHVAVAEQHSVVVHHVDIQWTQHDTLDDDLIYVAEFKLPVSFCEYRCTWLAAAAAEATSDEDEVGENCQGYVCVQYSNINVPVPHLDVPIDRLVDLSEKLTWVGHCIVTKVLHDEDMSFLKVHLHLHQSSFTVPDQLLDGSAQPATVELIGKPLPNRSVTRLC